MIGSTVFAAAPATTSDISSSGTSTAIIIGASITGTIVLLGLFGRLIGRYIDSHVRPGVDIALQVNNRLYEQSLAWSTQRAETDKQIALMRLRLNWIQGEMEDDDE